MTPRPRPAHYALFDRQCAVIDVRDEPLSVPGQTRRAWLVDLAPFGRVRVEETVQRTAGDPDERVLRRDAFVAGEVLITPQAGLTAGALPAVFARAGAATWERVPGSETWLVRFADPHLDTLPAALEGFAGETETIRHAEGNGVGQGGRIPNDPLFSQQYALHNTGQTGGTSGADVRATVAWDIANSAPGVLVAVIDSGIDYNHADLADNIYRDAREIINGVDDDGNGFIDDYRGWNFVSNNNDPLDDHNHGTHVSGILGARGNNGIGVSGLVWTVQLLPVKVLNATNTGTTANMLSGINYARGKGVRIMNLSLENYPFSTAVSGAIDSAAAAGILMVICAGNSGTNNDISPNYPSSYPQVNIISVANTTNADVMNTGGSLPSNYGVTAVDLAAPGTLVYSTLRNNTYGLFTGTSMSTPHVTGTAALLCTLRPDATVADLRRWILDSADRLPSLAGRCVTGARLNVAAALQLAVPTAPPGFIVQPQAQSVVAGQNALFTVVASGSPPPTYQWRRDGVPIVGATTSALMLTGIQASSTGSYSIVLTNSAGSVTSNAVLLSVIPVVPSVAVQPQPQSVASGQDVTFTVGANGSPPFTYQWRKDGVAIAGETTATFTLGSVQLGDAGSYTVVITNSRASVTSAAATLTVVLAGPTARLSNLSVRTIMAVGQTLIVGVVVSGGSRDVLVRAVGPGLLPFGLAAAMADPRLDLFNGQTLVLSNDDWLASLAPTFTSVGAFGLSPGSKDAAVRQSLNGAYSIQARGAGPGILLVEAYDLAQGNTPRMINVSARNRVGTGDDILIAGFNIAGTGTKQLLIRAVGPGLAAFGVPGTLVDPKFELYSSAGVKLTENDNWTPNLAATFTSVGAFALQPGSRDAALLTT
ncbi:MAG: S8 family serine peptidase, partial [Opitutaceae bacterium]